jgi:hypothetical protein
VARGRDYCITVAPKVRDGELPIRIDKPILGELRTYAKRHSGALKVTVAVGGSGLNVDVAKRVGHGHVYRGRSTPLDDIPDIATAMQLIDRAIGEMLSAN